MQTAPRHLSTPELEDGLPEVLASPRDEGRLEAIVIRPAPNDRRLLTTVRLTPEHGVEGDRWADDVHHPADDGRPDLRNQVSLMNARFLRQIAGHDDAMCLAGDNLIVDLDLSEDNLPTGSQLAIGDAVIEVSDLPHTGCTKLASRYGEDVRSFMNSPRGRQLHLRGRYARIVQGGTITVGLAVRKLNSP